MVSREENPLLIFIVNDEAGMLKLHGMVIRHWYPDATVKEFTSSLRALDELLISEPDLLITDDRMPNLSGGDLVNRICDRPVDFPILVISPWTETAKWVKDFDDFGLNISLLLQPFELEAFKQELDRQLESSDRVG